MMDEEERKVRFLKGKECLVDAFGESDWYGIPVVLGTDCFEMDSVSASFM